MPLRQAGASEGRREGRILFRSRGTQRGGFTPVLYDTQTDEEIDSDEIDWEEFVLLEEDRATQTVPSNAFGESTGGILRNVRAQVSFTPATEILSTEGPRPMPAAGESGGDLSLNERWERWESLGITNAVPDLYPCPDMWQIETFLSRATDSMARVDETSSEHRAVEDTHSRGIAARNVREASHEERSNDLRLFRQFLTRSASAQTATSRKRNAARQTKTVSSPSFSQLAGNCHLVQRVECPVPAFTSLLTPGMEFKGFQRCPKAVGGGSDSASSIEDWIVHAQIRRYDVESGHVCGTMAAYVKNNDPVETFWEGEIIDNKNHTFLTDKWDADTQTDLRYWTKFPAFDELNCSHPSKHWQSPLLKEYPYIFMRWKETYFITKTEQSLLTIQGFYYVCMRRQTGEMLGYYFDPECQPFQELELSPNRRGRSGFAFSNAQFI